MESSVVLTTVDGVNGTTVANVIELRSMLSAYTSASEALEYEPLADDTVTLVDLLPAGATQNSAVPLRYFKQPRFRVASKIQHLAHLLARSASATSVSPKRHFHASLA